MHDVTELGTAHFARAIERRLQGQARASALDKETRAALAHAFAGALLSLLSWWLQRDMAQSPREMDALFHRLVGRAVNAK